MIHLYFIYISIATCRLIVLLISICSCVFIYWKRTNHYSMKTFLFSLVLILRRLRFYSEGPAEEVVRVTCAGTAYQWSCFYRYTSVIDSTLKLHLHFSFKWRFYPKRPTKSALSPEGPEPEPQEPRKCKVFKKDKVQDKVRQTK